MNSFKTDIKINAQIDTVWATLADIGTISKWNPGVIESHATTDGPVNLGSTRHCNLGSNNFLDEKVVVWKPNEQLTMRIIDTNMPFQQADIHFFLNETEGFTTVTVSPEYKLKYGFVGKMLDKLFVARTYEKGMGNLLAGLKAHIESL
ncbi:MAG: SRPBCC family protein [Chloroflexota bacterium]